MVDQGSSHPQRRVEKLKIFEDSANVEQDQLLIDEQIDEDNLLSISQRESLEFEEHSDK